MTEKDLEKILNHDQVQRYSKTYYLILEQLLFITDNTQFPHYTKTNWLRQKDGNFNWFAEMIHEWSVEFQLRHNGHEWNGDYQNAVWEFVDEKLEGITKEK